MMLPLEPILFTAFLCGVVLALNSRKSAIHLPDAPDPEREYRRLVLRLRHPWKARLARLTGVE